MEALQPDKLHHNATHSIAPKPAKFSLKISLVEATTHQQL